MAHTHWIYPIDLSGDEEAKQACEKQPHFMLECSKIQGASFMRETLCIPYWCFSLEDFKWRKICSNLFSRI